MVFLAYLEAEFFNYFICETKIKEPVSSLRKVKEDSDKAE